ncbi:MAG: hypothetical protein IKZ87_05265, partial [Actinomycetaceae bacterium]|nr:hypothetical protein [Actinomycetaceae bacterium]
MDSRNTKGRKDVTTYVANAFSLQMVPRELLGEVRFEPIEVPSPETLAAAGGGMFAASAIYTKDWYADPNGDDDNPGFTPKTAK